VHRRFSSPWWRSPEGGVSDPNVEFKVMDGQDLAGVADRTVDGVNRFSALMFMLDPAQCLREMRRVLKKGALATVGTWSRTELGEVADKFGRYLGAWRAASHQATPSCRYRTAQWSNRPVLYSCSIFPQVQVAVRLGAVP